LTTQVIEKKLILLYTSMKQFYNNNTTYICVQNNLLYDNRDNYKELNDNHCTCKHIGLHKLYTKNNNKKLKI